jgi:hypothetical protein
METYNVLVGVHDHVEAVLPHHLEQADGVLDPFLVVEARPAGFDRFPCEDISDGIVAVLSEASEVYMYFSRGEWPRVEVDSIWIEEPVMDVRGLVGMTREFRVSGHIDAAKNHLTMI